MHEAIEDSREELKRVDHLIFVSLKYTRTVDVLLNVVNRMIDSYDHSLEALLRYAKHKGLIEEAPPQALARADLILKKMDDEIIRKNIETYLLFRKITKAKYERLNEFRRHVTLKTKIDGKDVEINIDNLTEYYAQMKDFLNHIRELTNNKIE